MILFICPACRETYVVPVEFAGKEIQCRACKATVPAQAAVPAAANASEVPAEAKPPRPAVRSKGTQQNVQIEFVCPVCGERYQVSEKLAGKKMLCRVCGEPARAPSRHRENH
jgi:transcription elongation factor Elf1